jgi:hypothetical protein
VGGDMAEFHEKGRLEFFGFLKKLGSSKVLGTPGILDFWESLEFCGML